MRLLIIMLCSLSLSFPLQAKHFYVDKNNPFFDASKQGVQPGDSIMLVAGNYPFVGLVNIRGSAQQPILILAQGGQVTIGGQGHHYGVSIRDCQHFRFTGKGLPGISNGIVITDQKNTGLGITGTSSDYEIDHIEISKTGFAGIQVKCDPICDQPSTWAENFTIKNIRIHDNFIHDTGGEGMYIGHTGHAIKQGNCKGLHPPKMSNVYIAFNTIERTGWDGIQVTNAIEDVVILGNQLIDFSQAKHRNHSSGIFVGEGSYNVSVSNNQVINGNGASLALFSANAMMVFNNYISFSGADGIYIGKRISNPVEQLVITGNTIVNPKDHGIITYNSTIGLTVIRNNMIVEPQKIYEYKFKKKARAYIMIPDHVTVRLDSVKNLKIPQLDEKVGEQIRMNNPRYADNDKLFNFIFDKKFNAETAD
ncbi:right-handed parallel beta-helix repeat-containing protein [Persicobacter psychrovividus]